MFFAPIRSGADAFSMVCGTCPPPADAAFAPADLDLSKSPHDDFFQYANGSCSHGWCWQSACPPPLTPHFGTKGFHFGHGGASIRKERGCQQIQKCGWCPRRLDGEQPNPARVPKLEHFSRTARPGQPAPHSRINGGHLIVANGCCSCCCCSKRMRVFPALLLLPRASCAPPSTHSRRSHLLPSQNQERLKAMLAPGVAAFGVDLLLPKVG